MTIDRRFVGAALMAAGAAAILVGALGLLVTGGGNPSTAGAAATGAARASTAAGASAIAVAPTTAAAPASSSLAPTPAPPSFTPAPITVTPGPTSETGETVPAFLARWTAAFRTGDTAFLLARLNPIVIARYGVATCQQAIHRLLDPAEVNTLLGSSGPATWTWVASGRSVQVADVYTASIDRTFKGQATRVTFHFADEGGALTWFDTCGTPLP